MNRFVTVLLIALVPIYGGCGGEAAGGEAGADVAIEDEENAEHFLAVTVDGARFEARGTLFGPSVTFSGREINVQVGGPLTSALASGKSVSLGDYDLKLNVLTNSILPGDYSIVSNRNRVARTDDPQGFLEVFFPDSEALGKLSPLSGTLTVDSADGTEDEGRYRLQRATGHASGQFRDSTGAEHAVEIEFIYVR